MQKQIKKKNMNSIFVLVLDIAKVTIIEKGERMAEGGGGLIFSKV